MYICHFADGTLARKTALICINPHLLCLELPNGQVCSTCRLVTQMYGPAARDEAGANAVECLKIELVLRLLAHDAQVRSQGCLGDRLCVVIIVLLPLHERLYIDRWNDPRLVAKLA